MKFDRVWAMANADTLECQPIGGLVRRYIQPTTCSVDPFARNCMLATWRNDLNPATKAEYHMDSIDFLRMCQQRDVAADLIIFDPPFSPRQVKECYESVGIQMGVSGAWRSCGWKKEKDLAYSILRVGGIVISLGWNTVGMGECRNCEAVEFLCVCHGPGHNDTLCLVEKKLVHQEDLFAPNSGSGQHNIQHGKAATGGQ